LSCAAKGDLERALVVTERARQVADRYLAARADDGIARSVSYSPARRGRRLSIRGNEVICEKLGLIPES
jgi:hypothetical protein